MRAALDGHAAIFSALRAGTMVEYPAVWAAKRAVLEAAVAALPRDHARFAVFRQEQGAALDDFAAFAALSEHFGPHGWPTGHAHPADAGMWTFHATAEAALRFHAVLQWFCDIQLGAAAAAGPGSTVILRSAPRPMARRSGRSRAPSCAASRSARRPTPSRRLVRSGASRCHILMPKTTKASHAFLRANMRHARALRLDHAMGLERLFVVPEGAPASEGCYLGYDGAGLLATLARESRTAGCAVVGEALGTVPEGFADRLAAARVLAYRVLWFETDGGGFRDPASWPELAAACVSTHDLATLAGWWDGADIEERAALGLLAPAAVQGALAARQASARHWRQPAVSRTEPFSPAIAAAVHRFVATAPSRMLLVQAEDLAGECIGVNLPGTDRERPNWRRRLPFSAQRLVESDLSAAILAQMAARGGRSRTD